MPLRILFILGAAFLSLPALAGDFRVDCHAKLDNCSSLISDLVSPNFLQHFPISRFKLAIVAEVQTFQTGGGVGFAFAGVSPVVADGSTQLPIRKYTESSFNKILLNESDVTKEMEGVIRDAVRRLMTACDQSPNCDVYKPY